jgi:hypothetical protein
MADRMDVRLSDTDKTELTLYLNSRRNSDGSIDSSAAQVFDGNSQAHRDERVRGLLLILAQHPDFQVR